MIRVTTRHSEDFDILSCDIDPARSPYAELSADYALKIRAFYSDLGVQMSIWTNPVEQPPSFFEPIKPVEYMLEIAKDRIVAYVDEETWSPFLLNGRPTFEFSRTPVSYKMTSILVAAPIRPEEVKEVRRYRRGNRGNCELVTRTPWVHPSPRL